MDKKPSFRIQKINAVIQQIVGQAILEFGVGFPGIITITKVETSRDLRWCKIWISVVNGEADKALETLKKNIYDIQGSLNHKLQVKILPRISFHIDTSGEYAAYISSLINKTHSEDEPQQPLD
jgi:ribosome-binding factor A